MSIDLTLVGPGPFARDQLTTGIQKYGKDWLVAKCPCAVMYAVEERRRVPLTDQLIGERDGLAVVSWEGTEDGVALVTVIEEARTVVATFSVGATRSPTEYVLALLSACALQRLWNVDVHDDNLFWGDEILDSESVRAILAQATSHDFEKACHEVVATRARSAYAGGNDD